jgi:hypothetical protein
MAAIDISNCDVIRVTGPSDIVTHWNPREKDRFFWVDDAFGATQYNRDTADLWNKVLPTMSAALRCGNRFVLASRLPEATPRAVRLFLTSRTDAEFRKRYIQKNPKILSDQIAFANPLVRDVESQFLLPSDGMAFCPTRIISTLLSVSRRKLWNMAMSRFY